MSLYYGILFVYRVHSIHLEVQLDESTVDGTTGNNHHSWGHVHRPTEPGVTLQAGEAGCSFDMIVESVSIITV